MEKLLLTPEEVSEALGVGRSKVHDLLRRGEIQSVRIGGSRRIPCDALESYVDWLRQEAAGYEVG